MRVSLSLSLKRKILFLINKSNKSNFKSKRIQTIRDRRKGWRERERNTREEARGGGGGKRKRQKEKGKAFNPKRVRATQIDKLCAWIFINIRRKLTRTLHSRMEGEDLWRDEIFLNFKKLFFLPFLLLSLFLVFSFYPNYFALLFLRSMTDKSLSLFLSRFKIFILATKQSYLSWKF